MNWDDIKLNAHWNTPLKKREIKGNTDSDKSSS